MVRSVFQKIPYWEKYTFSRYTFSQRPPHFFAGPTTRNKVMVRTALTPYRGYKTIYPPYNFHVLSFSWKLHFRRFEVCSQFRRFAISIGARSAPEKKCSAISTCLQFLHFQNLWSAAISMLLQFLHSAIYRVYAISTDYNFHTRAERASEKSPI